MLISVNATAQRVGFNVFIRLIKMAVGGALRYIAAHSQHDVHLFMASNQAGTRMPPASRDAGVSGVIENKRRRRACKYFCRSFQLIRSLDCSRTDL